MKRFLPIFLLLFVLGPVTHGATSDPLRTARHVWHFADVAEPALVVSGDVKVGVGLEGEEREESLKRGGDGRIARFGGGWLTTGNSNSLLKDLRAFSLLVRLKPAGGIPDGTIVMQRAPGMHQSGAFELSAWPMPFLERRQIAFQGMIAGGLPPMAAAWFPAVNFDWDAQPLAQNGWYDLIVVRAAGGPLRFYCNGRLVGERKSASIIPGPFWGFRGAASALKIGATPEGGSAFRGLIDHVALWDRALADAELRALSGDVEVRDERPRVDRPDKFVGTGSFSREVPIPARYDWFDARLPAFREHLEKTDPHYPRYHLTLPGEQWNRIAFFHGGKHHMFVGWTSGGCFKYFDDAFESIVWQHLTSEDLVHWRILPMPIRSVLHPNENGTFFVNDRGEVVTLYYGGRGSEPRMAVSRDADLIHWESFPDTVRFAGIPPEMQARHDPSAVFKRGEFWYQVATTVRPQARSMALPLYRSKDLEHWDYAGTFYEDASGRPINECGQLFPLDGRYVFTSIHELSKHATYMVGQIQPDGTFQRQFAGVPDYHSLTYNDVSTSVDDAGRATMWKFMNVARPFRDSSAAGWRNTYSIARELRLSNEGRLLVRPSPTLEKLRGKHRRVVVEAGEAKAPFKLADFAAGQAEVRIVFPAENRKGETGIFLSDGHGSIEAYFDHQSQEMVLDFSRLRSSAETADGRQRDPQAGQRDNGSGSALSATVGGVHRAPLPVQVGAAVTLRFYADRSVFEVYGNDEVVISNAAFFREPAKLEATVFDRSGSSARITVDTWEMRPLKWSSQAAPRP